MIFVYRKAVRRGKAIRKKNTTMLTFINKLKNIIALMNYKHGPSVISGSALIIQYLFYTTLAFNKAKNVGGQRKKYLGHNSKIRLC